MRKTTKLFFLLVLLSFPLNVLAEDGAKGNNDILMSIPVPVIEQIVSAVVPVQLNTESSILSGVITIEKVDSFIFESQSMSCRITLSGKDVHLVTELMGHQIRVKVGNVNLQLGCKAIVRFDEKIQTLFIKPVISDVDTGSGEGSAEIGQALTSLLDGREFAVKLDEISPLVAEVSNKTINVRSHVSKVRINSKGIMLNMVPVISEEK